MYLSFYILNKFSYTVVVIIATQVKTVYIESGIVEMYENICFFFFYYRFCFKTVSPVGAGIPREKTARV